MKPKYEYEIKGEGFHQDAVRYKSGMSASRVLNKYLESGDKGEDSPYNSDIITIRRVKAEKEQE